MSTYTIWVVPNDPERREHPNRDAALARAWELTPPGGRRAEPQERVKITKQEKKSITDGPIFDYSYGESESYVGFDYSKETPTTVVKCRMIVSPEIDLARDGALLRKEMVRRMNHEAAEAGMVMILESFRTSTEGRVGDEIIVTAACEARPMTKADAEASELAKRIVPHMKTAEEHGKRLIDELMDMSESAKKADERYRMFKKALEKGVLFSEDSTSS